MAAGATTLVFSSCATPRTRGLDTMLGQLADRLDPDGRYRHPTRDERSQAVTATDRLLTGDPAAASFDHLGMDTSVAVDPATGRRYALAASRAETERAWGLLVIDLTAPPVDLLLEVPHPVADQDTEQIGLALFRAIPGAALLVAGAHRRAAARAADVAHQPKSLFHALATHLADRGLAQLQLHGFHDDSLPDHQIVISASAGQPDHHTERTADHLTRAGLDVCHAWRQGCGSLEGRRNRQGRAAAEHGHPFIHLEINRSTRVSPELRTALIDAIAATYS